LGGEQKQAYYKDTEGQMKMILYINSRKKASEQYLGFYEDEYTLTPFKIFGHNRFMF